MAFRCPCSCAVAGSLLGVAVFALLSWLELPPVVWFGVAETPPVATGRLDLRGFAVLTAAISVVMAALILVRLEGPGSVLPWLLLVVGMAFLGVNSVVRKSIGMQQVERTADREACQRPRLRDVPTPVGVKNAGIPAPAARIRSASVPCGVISTLTSPDAMRVCRSSFAPM